jgi:hypothetical protein
VQALIVRHPDTGDATGDDIALVMNPTKGSSSNWLDSGTPGGSQNVGIAVNWSTDLLVINAFGAARDGGGARAIERDSNDRNWIAMPVLYDIAAAAGASIQCTLMSNFRVGLPSARRRAVAATRNSVF